MMMKKKMSHFNTLALLFLIFILFSIFYSERYIHQDQQNPEDHHNNAQYTFHYPPSVLNRSSKCRSTVKYNGQEIKEGFEKLVGDERRERCDVFSGKWVFDNTSYPLYNEFDCPYMSDQLACHKHGRPDFHYHYWRWQPHGCNLKRWNALQLWEKLRGKRLMFVGDSLNRGQWISMLCLLQSVIPVDKRSITPQAHLTTFRAEEYNATVEFLWAPLLVESNSDDPVDHRLDERIMRPDSVLRHSQEWEHADILVFNSYLWWRQGPVKLLWSTERNGVCQEIDELNGMKFAMEAWANWVDSNVDPIKKKVFFVTMSPTHQLKEEWEPEGRGNCYNEVTPINNKSYWGSGSDLRTMQMVKKVLNRLGPKVTVLNITQLSEYRKDGHPSIYRKFWELFCFTFFTSSYPLSIFLAYFKIRNHSRTRKIMSTEVKSNDLGEGSSVVVRSDQKQLVSAQSAPLSRYESQKRRDWNTFGQYLKNQRPPVSLSQCNYNHVLEFLRYLDQFGKTKVHLLGCVFYGQPDPPAPCTCPLRQAWGSLDALIGRLRAAYEENGGSTEKNPFGNGAIRVYLREVKECQAKARGIPYKKKKKRKLPSTKTNDQEAAVLKLSKQPT